MLHPFVAWIVRRRYQRTPFSSALEEPSRMFSSFWAPHPGISGLGLRRIGGDFTTILKNQMEGRMEEDMETLSPFKGLGFRVVSFAQRSWRSTGDASSVCRIPVRKHLIRGIRVSWFRIFSFSGRVVYMSTRSAIMRTCVAC